MVTRPYPYPCYEENTQREAQARAFPRDVTTRSVLVHIHMLPDRGFWV